MIQIDYINVVVLPFYIRNCLTFIPSRIQRPPQYPLLLNGGRSREELMDISGFIIILEKEKFWVLDLNFWGWLGKIDSIVWGYES